MSILKILLQVPAWILLVISFVASIYVYITQYAPIKIATPILLGLICICYLVGRLLEKKEVEDDDKRDNTVVLN